jgi:hypothetical protein
MAMALVVAMMNCSCDENALQGQNDKSTGSALAGIPCRWPALTAEQHTTGRCMQRQQQQQLLLLLLIRLGMSADWTPHTLWLMTCLTDVAICFVKLYSVKSATSLDEDKPWRGATCCITASHSGTACPGATA